MYLICGEALYDFFAPPAKAGSTKKLYFDAAIGGSPLNLAVGIRRLGAAVGLCAGISTDQLGAHLLTFLEQEKINTDCILRSQRPTPISLAQTDSDGLPHYVFYGTGGADTALTTADLPQDLSMVNGIHFGSYATVVPPIADALQALAVRAQDQFLAYDPNVRATVQPDLNIWRARFSEYLHIVDYIKLSMDDFTELFPGQSPAVLAESWLAKPRLQLVILTDEWRDIRAWHKRGYSIQIQPEQAATIVDSVAAGDSFQAAMLTQFNAADKRQQIAAIDNITLREKIHFASRCAAYTCAQRGANLPRRGDISGPL